MLSIMHVNLSSTILIIVAQWGICRAILAWLEASLKCDMAQGYLPLLISLTYMIAKQEEW